MGIPTQPFRFRRMPAAQVQPAQQAVLDEETTRIAGDILRDVRAQGAAALRAHAERLGDIAPGAALVIDRVDLQSALAAIPAEQRALLERTAARIRRFADAQRRSLAELCVRVPGGYAGHTIAPVEVAGCYAPGGRFPLPSSVLMTAVTARAAGVAMVVVASPRPLPITLAAAAIAGADMLLAVGGAQAVAALAYGVGVPRCDIIVGPGNRYVTAAKQLVAGTVGIDMLAGPSELLVIADASADADLVAADLLAQAEHDPDALPLLVVLDEQLTGAVETAIEAQLADLPTAAIARQSLANGFAVHAPTFDVAAEVADRLAPEHLALHVADPAIWAARLKHYGALFEGSHSAEVFGDYGIGPNHVLPTGGAARLTGGLSVFDFLRVRTWLRLDAGQAGVVDDAVALARLERLEAHARSAARRRNAPET